MLVRSFHCLYHSKIECINQSANFPILLSCEIRLLYESTLHDLGLLAKQFRPYSHSLVGKCVA